MPIISHWRIIVDGAQITGTDAFAWLLIAGKTYAVWGLARFVWATVVTAVESVFAGRKRG